MSQIRFVARVGTGGKLDITLPPGMATVGEEVSITIDPKLVPSRACLRRKIGLRLFGETDAGYPPHQGVC